MFVCHLTWCLQFGLVHVRHHSLYRRIDRAASFLRRDYLYRTVHTGWTVLQALRVLLFLSRERGLDILELLFSILELSR